MKFLGGTARLQYDTEVELAAKEQKYKICYRFHCSRSILDSQKGLRKTENYSTFIWDHFSLPCIIP